MLKDQSHPHQPLSGEHAANDTGVLISCISPGTAMPLSGEHAANDTGPVDWEASKHGQETLKLKHPSNRRRTK